MTSGENDVKGGDDDLQIENVCNSGSELNSFYCLIENADHLRLLSNTSLLISVTPFLHTMFHIS